MSTSQDQQFPSSGVLEFDSRFSQDSLRILSEKMALTHQVFERCRRLKLPAPHLKDLDDFVEGRTLVMPPAAVGELDSQEKTMIRFAEYQFTDPLGHPLTNCVEFLELVDRAFLATAVHQEA